MKRIGALLVCFLFLLPASAMAAETIYESGANIIIHADSPWYIYDGQWTEGAQKTEKDEYGMLFMSISEFSSVFNIPVHYNSEDKSIYVLHDGREIWQGLDTPVMFVDKLPYPNPAAYLSETGEVMIPLEPYASVFGYRGVFSTSEAYAPGQIEFTHPAKVYTIESIDVNKAMQMVTVFAKDGNGNIRPIRHFLCSTGAPLSLTPNGTFTAKPLTYGAAVDPWYFFSLNNCWILYCTQLTGNICFHSVPFNGFGAATLSSSGYHAMGNPASHGCIRLLIEDAKYIWENCKNVPVTISDGFMDENLSAIKQNLQANRPSYTDYVAELMKTY